MTDKKTWYVQRHNALDAKSGAFIDTEMHKDCTLVKECATEKEAQKELETQQK